MKKLRRLKLKEFHQMNEGEMKGVVGGTLRSKPAICDKECTTTCSIEDGEGKEHPGQCKMTDVPLLGGYRCRCVVYIQ